MLIKALINVFVSSDSERFSILKSYVYALRISSLLDSLLDPPISIEPFILLFFVER
ncbi:uncharacterized protein METZ01_LOCUS26018 [marine metagenome]|uniref:Uncharacterized protein n=1 Tax=marine metagenome TaxID=408172 RepID=A0A381Q2M8_9ZZZZ